MSREQVYIAFLRGINVSGKNKMAMKELVVLCERLGCTAVQTYIQSGNVIFKHQKSRVKN